MVWFATSKIAKAGVGKVMGAGAGVASAVSGGSGGKYIGDNEGRAWLALLGTVMFSIYDIWGFGLAPSPERTFAHLVFVILISGLVLGGSKRVVGTLSVIFLAQGLSSIIFFFMDSSTWKSAFFNLDFTAVSPQLIIDTLIHAGISWVILAIVLTIFIKKDFFRVESGLVIGFFLAIYLMPIFKAVETVLLSSGFSGFDAIMAGIINILYLFPIWIIILQMTDLVRPIRGIVWVEKILFFIVLLAVAGHFSFVLLTGGYTAGGIDPGERATAAWEFLKTTLTEGWGNAIIGFNAGRTNFQNDLDRAQGKDIDSEIERGAIRDVGLKLTPIESSPDKIYVDSVPTFFTTLEAKTFDAPIKANASCYLEPADKTRDNIYGDLGVQSQITVTDYANKQLACRFDQGQIAIKGGYTSHFEVDFNYVASAYLRRYFVKPGFLSQYSGQQRRPEDLFLNEYGDINSKESVRTQGPVDLAIGTPSVVTELLPQSYPQSPLFLEFQLESVSRGWSGKLSDVTKIILSVPTEFTFSYRSESVTDEDNPNRADTIVEIPDCTDADLDATIELLSDQVCEGYDSETFGDLDCTNFQHVVITPSDERTTETEKDIKIGCYITPSSTLIPSASSFAEVTFRGRVSYEYKLETKKTFTVQKSRDPNYISPSLALEQTKIGGIEIDSEVPYKQEYSLILSQSRREIYEDIQTAMSALPIFNDEDQAVKDFTQAYIYYHWDRLERYAASGKYKEGGNYGILRMNSQKLDNFVKSGGITLADLKKYGDDDPAATETIELSYTQKQQILDNWSTKLGILYFEHLIKTCSQGSAIDPACVFGKYDCHPDFVWNDFNSCGSSYDTCNACHSSLIPKMYTYVRDIACNSNDAECWPE